MAEDRQKNLDAKTRKIAQSRIPAKGKESAAYQSAEKQLLAIRAEQERNLELAKLSARSDAQQTETLVQAAQVAADSAGDGASEAVAQPVNPATQATLQRYGVGQPRFIKKQSSSQQVTRQNVVINNNTTNQTTNNVTVPPNIGGPLQSRPIQFGPQAAANSSGKFKLWLSQTLAKQKEEAGKRDRDWERRDSSLTRGANKMMRKLEEIGRNMSERLDPRTIGTTITSQLKALLFIFGMTFLATNWKGLLKGIDKIEKGIIDFGHWLGFGEQNGDSGLVKSLKYLFGGEKDDKRNLGEIIYNLFWTKKGATRKGLINILIDYFDALIEDRKEALKAVTSKPLDIGAFGGVLEGLGLDKGFAALGNRLGDILTALISGTAGLKGILAKTYNNELKTTSIESGKEGDSKAYFNTFDAKPGSAFYDKDNNTYAGDAALGNTGLHEFDFNSDGSLKQTVSAAKHQGDAIVNYLSEFNRDKRGNIIGKQDINTGQIITGLSRIQKYLESTDKYNDYRRYNLGPDKLEALRLHFGIDKDDPEWKAILSEAKKHGQYKYIRRKLSEEEKAVDPNQFVLGKTFKLTNYKGRDYVFEIVSSQDKRPGVKNSKGEVIGGTGYGIDRQLFDRFRHLVEKYTHYKGDKEGDELQFNLEDQKSVSAINNKLVESKKALLAEEWMRNSWARTNTSVEEGKKLAWKWAESKLNRDEQLESHVENLRQAEASHQRIEDANQQLATDFGESNLIQSAKHTSEYIDKGTNAMAEKIEETTGINMDWMKTDYSQSVTNFQTRLITPKEENQWTDKYNSEGTGLIALVGDSYAVGMAPHFIKLIEQNGGTAKATIGTEGNHQAYCVPGATIYNTATQVQSALKDGASIIIFHVGIYDWLDTDNKSIRKKFINLIEKSSYKSSNDTNGRKGQAKLYLTCPIIGQPRIQGNLVLGEQVKRINTVIRSVCSSRGIGCLDLEPSSGKYKTWSKDGIQPGGGAKDYKIMATDLVGLMKGEKIPMVPVVNPGQSVQGAGGNNGQVGTASGSQEQIIAYAVDHFVKKGYTPEQASGIVGNLIREGLLTKDYGREYADNSGPSAGIAGFHSFYNGNKGELDQLKKYASQRGKDWTSLGTQLDYITEGSADAQKALGQIKNSNTVSESAKIWGHEYERFKGHENYNSQNYKNRISSGHDALSIYNKNKNNIANMYSTKGINGGSYKPGNYSEGFSNKSGGGLFSGGISGMLSNLFGSNTWLGTLFETISEMASHIWDFISAPFTKKEESIVSEDNKTKPTFTDPITSEYKDYEEYKKNPGKLKEGMTPDEWKKEVENVTGKLPTDLGPIDMAAEQERQEQKAKQNIAKITPETKKTLNIYTSKSLATPKESGKYEVDKEGNIILPENIEDLDPQKLFNSVYEDNNMYQAFQNEIDKKYGVGNKNIMTYLGDFYNQMGWNPNSGKNVDSWSSYEQYKLNPQILPEGLTQEQWQEEVLRRTGMKPEDILTFRFNNNIPVSIAQDAFLSSLPENLKNLDIATYTPEEQQFILKNKYGMNNDQIKDYFAKNNLELPETSVTSYNPWDDQYSSYEYYKENAKGKDWFGEGENNILSEAEWKKATKENLFDITKESREDYASKIKANYEENQKDSKLAKTGEAEKTYSVNPEGINPLDNVVKAMVTGNMDILGKKPEEMMAETLEEIKELIKQHSIYLKTGNDLAEIGVKATVTVAEVTQAGSITTAQAIASQNNSGGKTIRKNQPGLPPNNINNS